MKNRILKYNQFVNESSTNEKYLPSYEDCVEMCSQENSAFYESKFIIDGYNVSIFNYRLAQYNDFLNPVPGKPNIQGYEMRGISFVFNKDGSLYKRFLLLEKFFNLNQVPESMYSIVKNYKIKFVNNKEDGSIASFIQLPNGKIYGKSKMSFDNEQSVGINNIYKSDKDINKFVNWCIENNIIPVFEYVAPHNRIVLRYTKEELILLRLRDNITGRHIDIKDHLDKLGSIRVAPFVDDFVDLDYLIELVGTEIDKEGYVIHAIDDSGKDFYFKLKTPWYTERHGLLTNDLYRENILIEYILDDKIDDVIGQIPEDEKEAHARINKIISIVRDAISEKTSQINNLYRLFLDMNKNRKYFALKYRNHPNFSFIMAMEKNDVHDLVKNWIRDNTKRLVMARNWIKERCPNFIFGNPTKIEDEEDDN